MELFAGMEPLLRTFWFIVIPVSVIFLAQTVLTFTGADATDGLDADFDSNLSGTDAPFQLFSLRNLINFLLGFGWTGISLYTLVENKALLIAASVMVGILFVAMFFLVIRQVQRLGENNSFNISNTLLQTGSVYIPIPGNKTGTGKIQICVKGSTHEINAITENEKIPSGALIRVIKIESNNLVLVEKL